MNCALVLVCEFFDSVDCTRNDPVVEEVWYIKEHDARFFDEPDWTPDELGAPVSDNGAYEALEV